MHTTTSRHQAHGTPAGRTRGTGTARRKAGEPESSWRKWVVPAIAAILVAAGVGCLYSPAPTEAAVRFETPAVAAADSSGIIVRKNYTLLYNKEWNMPRWVAWKLEASETEGRHSRLDSFLQDPDLMSVESYDYSGSGYDRGHMCPAADNRYDRQAMKESFYMSNVCPQDHELNQGRWQDLEQGCRRWAKKYGSIYVVCGPIVGNGRHAVIGKDHKITVPDAFYKVILYAGKEKTQGIGFIFSNDDSGKWTACTIDSVEQATGIDFFPALPDDVEKEVEARCDERQWN